MEDEVIPHFWDMCRTCGGDGEISIYNEEGVEMQLEEKINAYLPITVTSCDDLPLALCRKCVDRLESCHQIVTSCIETDNRLRLAVKLEPLLELKEEHEDCNDSVLPLQDHSHETSNSIEKCEVYCDPDLLVQEEVISYSHEESNNVTNGEHMPNTSPHPSKYKINKDNVNSEQHTYNDSGKIIGKQRSKKQMLQCTQCSFKTNNCDLHIKHTKTHDETNDVAKYLCNQSLSSKSSIKARLKKYMSKRRHECQYCSRTFAQKSALQYHERRHTGECPFVCSFCSKGFNSKVVQQAHERIHTGERPFCCEECGASFKCNSNLRQHKVIHSKVRPFICHVCGKNFYRPETVRIHMRTHTGERPYACPICERAFAQKGDMMKHTMTHNKSTKENNNPP